MNKKIRLFCVSVIVFLVILSTPVLVFAQDKEQAKIQESNGCRPIEKLELVVAQEVPVSWSVKMDGEFTILTGVKDATMDKDQNRLHEIYSFMKPGGLGEAWFVELKIMVRDPDTGKVTLEGRWLYDGGDNKCFANPKDGPEFLEAIKIKYGKELIQL